MAATYRLCAKEILANLGGRENIVSIYHCMTRLRMVVKNIDKIDIDEIDIIDGVKGSYIRDGQVHIILGVGMVDRVYDEILMISNVTPVSKKELEEEIESRQSSLIRIIKTIGDIFIPILPAMIASGIMTGILVSIAEVWPSVENYDLYNLLKLISHTVMQYLPVLVAVSAGHKFGGNPYLAGGIGLMLLHRDLFVGWDPLGSFDVPMWNIGPIHIYQAAYEGHIIPIIIAIWFMCKLERWLHRHVTEIADIFITPLLTLMITAVFTFTVIGPILMNLETIVIRVARFVLDVPYGIGAAICAVFYPLSVVFGIQHMFMVLEVRFLADTHMNIWIRVASSANFAMCISCLAVALKTRSERLKGIALPAGISAALGVTEPAIFGINFRYHTPLICGMIGSGVGAAIGTILNVYGTAYGVTALPGIILSTPCLWEYIVMLLSTAIVTFSLTWFFWKDEDFLKDKLSRKQLVSDEDEDETEEKSDDITYIYSPLQGKVLNRLEIPDETFSEGYLGEGIGIIPDSGDVIAPFDGKIVTITPTNHAVVLEGPEGINILIHIGIDTVDLDGSHFTQYFQAGDMIQRGQKIMYFDLEALKEKGCNLTSAIFAVNHNEYSRFTIRESQNTSFGEILFELKK